MRSNLRVLRNLLLECSSEDPFRCIEFLGFESFSQFCKFSFVSKIIFQFLFVDVGFTSHLYFSKSRSHHNIGNCSTRASATMSSLAQLGELKLSGATTCKTLPSEVKLPSLELCSCFRFFLCLWFCCCFSFFFLGFYEIKRFFYKLLWLLKRAQKRKKK